MARTRPTTLDDIDHHAAVERVRVARALLAPGASKAHRLAVMLVADGREVEADPGEAERWLDDAEPYLDEQGLCDQFVHAVGSWAPVAPRRRSLLSPFLAR